MPEYKLSPAQTRIMELLIKEGSLNGVAKEMGVSKNTVSTQLTRIKKKMGLAHRRVLSMAIIYIKKKHGIPEEGE